MDLNRIYHHNVTEPWPLPARSIHTIVTSPPYWALRNYGVAGQIGLENTPEEFIAKMVLIFREAWRVLRDDGTLWINIGDTYIGGKGANGAAVAYQARPGEFRPNDRPHPLLGAKQMVGIPWKLAFALQDDGWILRQDIIWHKGNPMPESISDRCTKAHEYLFLFAKKKRYFFDAFALQEPASTNTHERRSRVDIKNKSVPDHYKNGIRPAKLAEPNSGIRNNTSYQANMGGIPCMRNKRSVWTINPQAFPEAHFATFPEELPITVIKAATSEHGTCCKCGAPYRRVLEPSARYKSVLGKGYHDHADPGVGMAQCRGGNLQNKMRAAGIFNAEYSTASWEQTCRCKLLGTDLPLPAVVLDPFMGAGTTGLVARKLQRNYIGLELNPKYITMAEKRLKKELGLFL